MKARETIAHPCERSSSVDTSSSNSTESGSRVIVIFSTRGVPRCFSVHRKRRGRVFQRHAESNFARERSSGVPPCSIRASGRTVPRRVARAARVDVGFLAGLRALFVLVINPGTRFVIGSWRAAGLQFSLPPYQTAVHRRFPNQKTRGCRSSGSDDLLTFMMSHTRAGKRRCSARIFGLAFLVPNRSPADSSGEVP